MIKSILSTMQDFESSSQQTPQYLAWFKLFKKEFTELLVNKFCISKEDILIGEPIHFYETTGKEGWYLLMPLRS